MRKLITDDKARINHWLYHRVGRPQPWPLEKAFNAVGVEDEEGNLIGGVIFDNFNPGASCTMYCAGTEPNWCSRRLLKFCFEYVFKVAGCKVIINTVSADNEKSIKFTKHVGFTEIARIRDGAGDCDLVALTLHRDDCKWLGGSDV